jgi:hypothetical protein
LRVQASDPIVGGMPQAYDQDHMSGPALRLGCTTQSNLTDPACAIRLSSL